MGWGKWYGEGWGGVEGVAELGWGGERVGGEGMGRREWGRYVGVGWWRKHAQINSANKAKATFSADPFLSFDCPNYPAITPHPNPHPTPPTPQMKRTVVITANPNRPVPDFPLGGRCSDVTFGPGHDSMGVY